MCQFFGIDSTMWLEMITQIFQKRFSFVTDVRALGKLFPSLVCGWHEVPYQGARLTQNNSEKPRVIDVRCNWEIMSQIIKICNHFGLGPFEKNFWA